MSNAGIFSQGNLARTRLNHSAEGSAPPSAHSHVTSSPGGSRLLWADCAKGLSIVAVCYMHVVTGTPGSSDSTWQWFNTFMDPIRMPLFFLISGLFAHRVISRTLGDLWYRRLWFLLVPYLVFTPVQAAIRIAMTEEVTWRSLGRAILVGDPGIWFLYALMVFNIMACLLRRVPPLVAVVLSVVPSVCISLAGLAQYNEVTHLTSYLPAFFLGLHFREVFFRLSAAAKDWRVIVGGILAYCLGEWGLELLSNYLSAGEWTTTATATMNLAMMVRIISAVPLGILLATWISWIPGVSTVFAGIGRHTLPIYVSHHAALHFSNKFIAALVADHPEFRGVLTNMDVRVLIGFATCAAAGFFFYWVGKLPVIGWVLYPPALPRRRHEAS